MSRKNAANYLGVSTGMVQHWEDRGVLIPIREGKRVYLPIDQLERLRAEYRPNPRKAKRRGPSGPQHRERGRIAAKAFKLFRDGKHIPDVVIELEIDPRYAEELWKAYTITPDERAELERQEKEDAAYRAETRARGWQDWRIRMKELDVKKAKVSAMKEGL